MNNPLWDYSLAHYARDGVAKACLALQVAECCGADAPGAELRIAQLAVLPRA